MCGLYFVHLMKNGSHRSGIKQAPYEAVLGCLMRMGSISISLPKEVIDRLCTEKDLEKVMLSYKDKQLKEKDVDSSVAPNAEVSLDTIGSSSASDAAVTAHTSKLTTYIAYFICNKPAFDAHTCVTCGAVTHSIFGEILDEQDQGYERKVLCSMCHNWRKCKRIREKCRDHLLRQAKQMVTFFDKKHMLAPVGDTIMVPVVKLDRTRAVFANIMGIINS